MTVLPGSLDYLYYNGILDHTPFEAYEMMPTGNGLNYNSMTGSEYLDMAQQGALYNTRYSNDSFMRNNHYYNNDLTSNGHNFNYQNSSAPYNNLQPKPQNNEQNYSIARQAFGLDENLSKENIETALLGGDEDKSIKNSITKTFKSAAQKVGNAPDFVKGIASAMLIVGTLAYIFKGHKKPPIQINEKQSLWSKIKNKFTRN
jgi:hypothetical protein